MAVQVLIQSKIEKSILRLGSNCDSKQTWELPPSPEPDFITWPEPEEPANNTGQNMPFAFTYFSLCTYHYWWWWAQSSSKWAAPRAPADSGHS